MIRAFVVAATVGMSTMVLTAPAMADAGNGEKVFKRCMACHSVEAGENKVGPSLHGVVGRHSAAIEDFKYSDAMKGANLVWDEQNLTEWLTNPRKFLKGTSMAFAGLRKESDVTDVIDYLKQQSE